MADATPREKSKERSRRHTCGSLLRGRPALHRPVALLVLLACGCAGGPNFSALNTASLAPGGGGSTAGTASAGQTAGLAAGPSPTEAYARIARGANRCWFGARGRLRTSHVLYAEAAPPSAGGNAEIIVHERDHQAERPWGARAFRITISSNGGLASIDSENLRMTQAEADRMVKEVRLWAADTLTCDDEPARPH